jgi:hypothetical protein
MLSFQRLEVYQRSIELLALDQWRGAAQSQPLNIAECAGRTSRPRSQALHDRSGSMSECAAILT